MLCYLTQLESPQGAISPTMSNFQKPIKNIEECEMWRLKMQH